jgi:hypothetical protein
MITQQNISAYINYLHQKRTNQNASAELLQKWRALSNAEIPEQLQNLYTHWNLDAASAQTHEANFVNFTNPQVVRTEPTNASIENYAPTPITVQKNNNFWPVLLGILIIGGGVGGFLAWKNNLIPESIQNLATNKPAQDIIEQPAFSPPDNIGAQPINDAPTATTEPPPSNVQEAQVPPSTVNNLEITQIDKENIQSISNLLEAEQGRDFESIYTYFAPEIRQYWDIKYPTKEELLNRYTDLWNKATDGKNLDMKVSKTANNKYRVTGMYEYFSLKSQITKTVPVNTIFEFNEDGKIVYENAAK